MITRYLIDCDCERPDWPFVPVRVPCGSSRTIGVIGLKSKLGATVTGCQIRVTNVNGTSMTKTCVKKDGAYCATFPASHFANFGTVKNGVVVFAMGKDESNADQLWIERVGDLKVDQISSSQNAGGTVTPPTDVYHKSSVVDGVQHYKREVLTYSARQGAWGAEYVGDYVFIGGDFVPFTGE